MIYNTNVCPIYEDEKREKQTVCDNHIVCLIYSTKQFMYILLDTLCNNTGPLAPSATTAILRRPMEPTSHYIPHKN